MITVQKLCPALVRMLMLRQRVTTSTKETLISPAISKCNVNMTKWHHNVAFNTQNQLDYRVCILHIFSCLIFVIYSLFKKYNKVGLYLVSLLHTASIETGEVCFSLDLCLDYIRFFFLSWDFPLKETQRQLCMHGHAALHAASLFDDPNKQSTKCLLYLIQSRRVVILLC